MNVQSLRLKTRELELFLDQLGFPAILLLTEHWLKIQEPIHIFNYIVKTKYCRNIRAHGGSIIFVRDDLDFSFREETKYRYLCEELCFECSVISCVNLNLYIVCIYRSPNSCSDTFLVRLELLLTALPPRSRIILTGDFNINYVEKNQRSVKSLTHLLHSHGLEMHVDNFTRTTGYSASILDYVCSNVDEFLFCSVLNPGLSDHEAVFCEFCLAKKTKKPNRRRGRIFSKRNFQSFSNSCVNINWPLLCEGDNPLLSFYHKLKEIFSQNFPIVKIKTKDTKPWITKGLKVSSKNMRCLHTLRKYLFYSTFFADYFYKYRRIYRKTIKAAMDKYYGDRLDSAHNKQRETWNIVNSLRGATKSKSNESQLDANKLNSFYCSVASQLKHTIPANSTDPVSLLKGGAGESFYFTPVTAREIVDVFQEINNKNSSGWDGISIKILANLPVSALTTLADCINASFLSGKFPDLLKRAIVIPIFKQGEDTAANYRPISLLPSLSKIIERLLKKRMIHYLEAKNILNSSQFGFRSSRNTNDAIFHVLEDLYLRLNDGEVAAVVLCDLAKAFDCVSHEILLRKLEVYGFRGSILQWLRSYLSNRCQRVYFDNCESEELCVTAGVPQGSVIGPLLFLIYVNDLPSVVKYGKCTSFADDTTLLWHGRNSDDLREMANRDLANVGEWCDINCLSFNVSKTNILNFKCVLNDVCLGSQAVNVTNFNKFLGLIIDDGLKFEQHIEKLCSRLASGCFAIKTVRSNLNIFVAREAYFALVDSHLRYGVCFWGHSSVFLFNSVFVLQKRALRVLCGLRFRDSCKPHFINQKILTLPSIFILETTCLMHKKYSSIIHSANLNNTRSSFNINLPIPSSSLTQNSIFYRSKKMFNHLPQPLRKIVAHKLFRRVVKKLLISKAYYSIEEYFLDNF